jgi:hypothetical protein
MVNLYLRYNLFAMAAAQIDTEKSLGANIQDQEAALDQARTAYLANDEQEIRGLIGDGHLDAAQSRLTALTGNLDKDSADRLNAEFQGQLAAYQQEETQALQGASNGDPATAYPTLSAFVSKYPHNVRAQLVLADLSTKLPPDPNRLGGELDSFRQISRNDTDADESVKVQAAQSHIQNELDTYNKLLAAVNSAKGGSNHTRAIARLRNEIDGYREAMQPRRGFDSVWNSVTRNTSLPKFHTAAAYQQAIDDDEAKIKELQGEDQAAQASPGLAQQNFDNFCKTVPW